jgi:hypothetical protein
MAEQLAKKVRSFKVPSSELPSSNKSKPENFSKNKENEESPDNSFNDEFEQATSSKSEVEEKIES